MDVPEHIKFLVLKWRKGRLGEAEQAELDSWYNSPMPETLYMEGQDEEQVKTKLFRGIEKELGDGKKTVVRKLGLWTRVAAAVVLLSGITLLYVQYSRYKITAPVASQIVESRTGIRRVILPDSSIVWLKNDSRLAFPATFGRQSREVELHGEALFEISHHKRWPFKIRSGNYVTTVLGTSFNLKTGEKDEDFVLSVLTGKVQVVKKSADTEAGIYLVSANQSFHANAGKVEKLVEAGKEEQVPELIKGTEYDMAFAKTPFTVIMKRFEQKFNVQFEGYTGEYDSCLITADLTNISFERSLQLLALSVNATYKINDNKITLTGGGCF